MSSTVQFLSAKQLAGRQKDLLAEAGVTLAELRLRRDRGLLDLETQGLLDELEDLEFLSGE